MSSPDSKLERRRARREAAKRQRESARHGQQRARFFVLIAIIAAAVAILVGVIAAVIATQHRPAVANARLIPLESDCNRPPPTQCPHLASGERYTKYNSDPPTSGPHWPDPAPWGPYDRTLPAEQLVHNLEHGGIVIYYNCRDCPDLVQQLKDAIKGWRHTVLVPYYDMKPRIALTAWRYIDELDQFDQDRVATFIKAYIDRGPEQVP